MSGSLSGIQKSPLHRLGQKVLGKKNYRRVSGVMDPLNLAGGSTPPPPEPEAPAPMPDEEEMAKARRRAVARRRSSGMSRQNTIFAEDTGGTLG